MKYFDNLVEEAKIRNNLTGREVIVITCLLPSLSAFFTFGGAHPIVCAFADPASEHIGPWTGVVAVGHFWIGTFAYRVWAFQWYKRLKSSSQEETSNGFTNSYP